MNQESETNELRSTNYEFRKIKSFTDLNAWKESHRLVLMIYQSTNKFPKEEIFGLTNQLRRAGISLTSNIAEGFSRNSWREKLQFYCMSLGSLTEIQNQLLIAKDVVYLSKEDFNVLAQQSVEVSKVINGLIKKTKTVIRNS